jgi:VanZ family protein
MPISPCNCAGIRLFLGLVLVITTYLSLTPQPAPLPDVAMADKWAHALTYLLLAFLVDVSWPEHRFDIRKWGTLFAYGLLIELIQSQIPNRLFSVGDLAANAAGIALYGGLALPLVRSRLSRGTPRN